MVALPGRSSRPEGHPASESALHGRLAAHKGHSDGTCAGGVCPDGVCAEGCARSLAAVLSRGGYRSTAEPLGWWPCPAARPAPRDIRPAGAPARSFGTPQGTPARRQRGHPDGVGHRTASGHPDGVGLDTRTAWAWTPGRRGHPDGVGAAAHARTPWAQQHRRGGAGVPVRQRAPTEEPAGEGVEA